MESSSLVALLGRRINIHTKKRQFEVNLDFDQVMAIRVDVSIADKRSAQSNCVRDSRSSSLEKLKH